MSIGPFGYGQWYRVHKPGGGAAEVQFQGPSDPNRLEEAFVDAQGKRTTFPSPFVTYCEIDGPGGVETGPRRHSD